jgi:hypothetical protein
MFLIFFVLCRMGLLLEGGRANAQIEKDNRHMFLIFFVLCRMGLLFGRRKKHTRNKEIILKQ